MASRHSFLAILFALSSILCLVCSQQLSVDYYKTTCPNLDAIVRGVTENATSIMYPLSSGSLPSALRLFFYDCFIGGCDASMLLGATEEVIFNDEDPRPPAALKVINRAKSAIDAIHQCKNKVSCADVMALVARDVIALSGGPTYRVELGRRDGLVSTYTSNPNYTDLETANIPIPYAALDNLTSMFAVKGLSMTDMVALSGAHTIGFTRCRYIDDRLYKYPLHNTSYLGVPINQTYGKQLRNTCVQYPETDQLTAGVNLDPVTPNKFDNQYYKNLKQGMGTFSSDQVLYRDKRSRNLVELFASNSTAFVEAFVSAMTKLGRVGVLTGKQGQIRLNCTLVNK